MFIHRKKDQKKKKGQEYEIAMKVNYILATCNNMDKSYKIILSGKSNS